MRIRNPYLALLSPLLAPLLATTALAVGLPAAAQHSVQVSVPNPSASIEAGTPGCGEPAILDLRVAGFCPGARVRIERLGDYCYHAPEFCAPFNPRPQSRTLMVRFSRTNTSRPGAPEPVPGSIAPVHLFEGSIERVIPRGAAYLFAAAEDSIYCDNSDHEKDFGFRITLLGDSHCSDCQSDAECGAAAWCRETQEGGSECVPYQAEGAACGGLAAPWATLRCAPDLSCVHAPCSAPDVVGTCGHAGRICGTTFLDRACNGARDGNDPPLAGELVLLGGSLSAMAVSDSQGRYCFEGLLPGAYTVVSTTRTVWTPTYPAAPGRYFINLGEAQRVDHIDFGSQRFRRCR
ncbi:MAG TPA: SdrD B-like domain-containing protein [Thermoanaerobaculia bacterium]|nr:SdrD B-like domain-containing protein [Thermoanaerobaculia bacterium]